MEGGGDGKAVEGASSSSSNREAELLMALVHGTHTTREGDGLDDDVINRRQGDHRGKEEVGRYGLGVVIVIIRAAAATTMRRRTMAVLWQWWLPRAEGQKMWMGRGLAACLPSTMLLKLCSVAYCKHHRTGATSLPPSRQRAIACLASSTCPAPRLPPCGGAGGGRLMC